jgi:hypothetical protein
MRSHVTKICGICGCSFTPEFGQTKCCGDRCKKKSIAINRDRGRKIWPSSSPEAERERRRKFTLNGGRVRYREKLKADPHRYREFRKKENERNRHLRNRVFAIYRALREFGAERIR